MADHNDPNAVNSIFSDIDVSAADLYDIFGFPSADTDGGEKVVIALTFASVPEPGVLDQDMLYRIQIAAEPRVVFPDSHDHSLENLLKHFDALKDKFRMLVTKDVDHCLRGTGEEIIPNTWIVDRASKGIIETGTARPG